MIVVHLSGTLCQQLNLICSAYTLSKKYTTELKLVGDFSYDILKYWNKPKYTKISAKSGNFRVISDISEVQDNDDIILTENVNIKGFSCLFPIKKFPNISKPVTEGNFYIYVDQYKPEFNRLLITALDHIHEIYFSEEDQLGERIKYIVLGNPLEIAKFPILSKNHFRYNINSNEDKDLSIMLNCTVGGISFSGKESLGWWGLCLNPTRPMMIIPKGIDEFDGSTFIGDTNIL